MRTKTLWLWLALLVTSLALVAAGCGGDDDEGGDAAGTGATTDEGGTKAANQEITINWGTEPPSLDPAWRVTPPSAAILLNIMDPLVLLDKDNEPQPSMAESWDISEDGKTVTYNLRSDGKWTNGDPVTAEDFEYSWKRTISPISPPTTRTSSTASSARRSTTRREVLRRARGQGRNQRGRRPDAGGQAHLGAAVVHPAVRSHSFLAVHKATVEKFGSKWTEAANIVTNGPSSSSRGSTTTASTSSRTRSGATPTASRSRA